MPAHAIAIVGLAGRFPGADGLDAFWRNVSQGVESLDLFTDAQLDEAGVAAGLRAQPGYVRRGTVLERAEFFDAGFFGMTPREAQILDPQQRIFLECAWEALEHAGYGGGSADRAVGVYAGTSMNTYLFAQVLRDPALAASAGGYQLMLGNDKDFLCTRVSYKLDLRGPSLTIQTACSTSLVAVEVACRALQRGQCDMALAGGVSVSFPQQGGYLFQEGMILSPDGHCRPFDAAARGTRSGAGAGIVVLKRLADAVADGDTVHAVIRGAAINNDGAGKAGFTAPSVAGQVEVIAMAQALADVEPRSISYIETHGTGTPLGDPIEVAALTQVFRDRTADQGFCRLGSLKANIGHLDAAAGVAGLIKAVLALQHRELPPLVNFRTPNPQLAIADGPFVLSAEASPWTTPAGVPRRAAVSSFGIGGTNAHVVIEEAPAAGPVAAGPGHELLVLSARTESALEQAGANLAAHLEAHPEASLPDIAWTLQAGRQAFVHRRAVVASDVTQAAAALRQPQRPPVMNATHAGGVRPVAFLFSGQGSQQHGMGRMLYATLAAYRDAVDRCAALLQSHLGLDIRDVLFGENPHAGLHQTALTQPALFVTEYALASVWMAWGLAPRAMLGHSIGEYVAAHLAGVMSLPDVLKVVAARGRLMQALPLGDMAAVHMTAAALRPLLADGVEIAAVNAPGLCSVAGPTAAVAALVAQLQASGVEVRTLHTSHAFHSAMMEPVLAPFTAVVAGVSLTPPAVPYISNVTGTWITAEQATAPDYYARHLRQAVQFEAGVRTLAGDPSLFLLEVGPGTVLTSLARQTLGPDGAGGVVASMAHARDSRPALAVLLEAAGRMWLAGAPIDWRAMHQGVTVRRVPLPTYPFERQRYYVPAAASAPPAVTAHEVTVHRRPAVDDWMFAPTWSRNDALGRRSPALQGVWVVQGGDAALTAAVTAQIAAAGGTPVPSPGGESLDVDATPASEDVAGVIDLSGVRRHGIATAADSAPLLLEYDTLVEVCRRFAPAGTTGALQVIHASTGTESVMGERVRHRSAGIGVGPVLVLPTESPGVRLRRVDLELDHDSIDVATAARVLVEEAATADAETIVAWRGGYRWVRRHERCSAPPPAPADLPLKPRGVYLITGGIGGMGLTLAGWLASSVAARLVLTTRAALPPRDQWDGWLAGHPADDRASAAIVAIRAIEHAGGEVMVVVADAADEAAMAHGIAAARARWGAMDGVIHAAGVAGTGALAAMKSSADVRATLAPKVQGLDVLVRLLGSTPLDFVALMSSINAVLGAPGTADYASANAVLDAFPDSAERPAAWTHVVSVNWGAWRDVGMAARLVVPDAQRAQWQQYLATAIAPEEGVDVFARVLASRRRRVVVVPYDLALALEQARAPRAAATAFASELPAAGNSSSARPELDTAFTAPGTDAERRVAAIWTELLGIDPIGMHDNFFQLGGHSLLATRLLARLTDVTGVRLALRDVFDAPTIHELAQRIASAAVPVPDGDREEIEL